MIFSQYDWLFDTFMGVEVLHKKSEPGKGRFITSLKMEKLANIGQKIKIQGPFKAFGTGIRPKAIIAKL